MFFKSTLRHNPSTGSLEAYYRIAESYRNMEGRICHKILLNIGFTDLKVEQLIIIRDVGVFGEYLTLSIKEKGY